MNSQRTSGRTKVRPLVENPVDGVLMLLIPGGVFLAGGPEADEGGGKPFEVDLPSYYLALHPVTNAQYARFLTARRPSTKELCKWILLERDSSVVAANGRFKADEAKADHPVVQVSWHGAEAYCEWARVRLPSELEWGKGSTRNRRPGIPVGEDMESRQVPEPRKLRQCRHVRSVGVSDRLQSLGTLPDVRQCLGMVRGLV